MQRRYPPIICEKEHNILNFWEESVEDGLLSERAGRPIFKNVLFVSIDSPGQKGETQDYEVETTYPESHPHPVHGLIKKNDVIQRRFKAEIERLREVQGGTKNAVDGTPIEEWALVNFRTAALLRSHGVLTVELLANLHDGALQPIGIGGRELRQKAKDWLLSANDKAAALQAAERERKLQAKLDAMQSQIVELSEALMSLPETAQAQVKATLAKKARQAAA